MLPHGKRSALRVIDRLIYLGPAADPAQGIRKGVKILEDRSHHNSNCCILHLSDSPAARPREAQLLLQQLPVPVHRFYVGFGFGASNGFVMHEFQEFLGRMMGGVVREAKVRVGVEGEWVRLGEVGGGEERRIPVDLKEDCEYVCVRYSYVEGRGDEEQLVAGETVVGFEDKGDGRSDGEREVAGSGTGGGRASCGETWDFFDPFMARRWAKHLHRA